MTGPPKRPVSATIDSNYYTGRNATRYLRLTEHLYTVSPTVMTDNEKKSAHPLPFAGQVTPRSWKTDTCAWLACIIRWIVNSLAPVTLSLVFAAAATVVAYEAGFQSAKLWLTILLHVATTALSYTVYREAGQERGLCVSLWWASILTVLASFITLNPYFAVWTSTGATTGFIVILSTKWTYRTGTSDNPGRRYHLAARVIVLVTVALLILQRKDAGLLARIYVPSAIRLFVEWIYLETPIRIMPSPWWFIGDAASVSLMIVSTSPGHDTGTLAIFLVAFYIAYSIKRLEAVDSSSVVAGPGVAHEVKTLESLRGLITTVRPVLYSLVVATVTAVLNNSIYANASVAVMGALYGVDPIQTTGRLVCLALSLCISVHEALSDIVLRSHTAPVSHGADVGAQNVERSPPGTPVQARRPVQPQDTDQEPNMVTPRTLFQNMSSVAGAQSDDEYGDGI